MSLQRLMRAIEHLPDAEAAAAVTAFDGDVNGRGDGGWTPLVMAVVCGKVAAIAAIAAAGGDGDAMSTTGLRPLCCAARRRNDALAAMLLHFPRVDVNARDAYGGLLTPLHHAANMGFDDNVGLLVDAGADPCARDARGSDVASVAELLCADGTCRQLRRAAFNGLRRCWLQACDAIADGATVVQVTDSSLLLLVPCVLQDTLRVVYRGDALRPRVLGSVFGGMVAMFLPAIK
jgi:hypothetical protein